MIQLSLLGEVKLLGADGSELRTVLARPKRLALLAFLAVAKPGGFHSRDALLALLWPELSQSHARAALRQALSSLRHSLGSDVVTTCGDIFVGVEDSSISCDVRLFNQTIARQDFVGALALYGGELLSGFHLTGAPEFEQWLDLQRSQLKAAAARAARELSTTEANRGDLAAALEWARRLLTLDPDDEQSVERIMTLLRRLGDRAAALRLYHEFEARLASNYELEPSPKIQALVSAIRLSDDGCEPARTENVSAKRADAGRWLANLRGERS